MRKIFYFLPALMLLGSCGGNDKNVADHTDSLALIQATREELVQAIDERDQLIELINDISTSTQDIKEMEKIISVNVGNGENTSSSQITANLEAIKATLQDRRERLAQLEEKLRKSNTSNKQLLATIETLKQQIEKQDAEIQDLKEQLTDANKRIASLDSQVDSLNSKVADERQARDAAQKEAKKQEELANACYYAIGSKDELKDHNIIEGGGFLKKQKIMPGDFDKRYFTQADKRTLTMIPLHSKKAKIVTSYQPKGSYEIIDIDGQKVLRILNPNQFWGVSNYLVIQID